MKVASFYRFLDLEDPAAFRDALARECRDRDLLGTVLVAPEGVNGTLAGDEADIRDAFAWIEKRLDLDVPVEARWSEADEAPFQKLKVRLKKEIVTLGRPDLKPHERAGTHVEPADWNALIDDPDVLVVDTRNRYEIEVGAFPRAADPATSSFREFPHFAEKLAARGTDRPVAMYCTGGIRCEKATALMLELGFDRVYHLKGGILNYLEQMPADENRWAGECFVFDKRVAVDRDLAEGDYVQCHACRRPLSRDDLASPHYREGVSCPHCIDDLAAERKARLEERRRQVRLARERGRRHLGPKNRGQLP